MSLMGDSKTEDSARVRALLVQDLFALSLHNTVDDVEAVKLLRDFRDKERISEKNERLPSNEAEKAVVQARTTCTRSVVVCCCYDTCTSSSKVHNNNLLLC